MPLVRTWPGFASSLSAAVSLLATVALVACGGESKESGSEATEEDKAAIKELILDYAAIQKGDAGCDLWSADVLARTGGRAACEQVYSSQGVVETYDVEEVEVDGDSGSVLVTVHPGGEQRRYPLVRDGEPTDSYDGWRVDEVKPDNVRVPTGTETTPQTTTTSPVEPETPQAKAAAYRTCIEGRGAKDVNQVGLDRKEDALPSIDFSGGGSAVNATFGSSEADAEQGLAAIKQRKPFFAERLGTIVLYSVGDPLADDLDTGLACAKEVG